MRFQEQIRDIAAAEVLGRTTAPPACPHTEKAAGQEHPTTSAPSSGGGGVRVLGGGSGSDSGIMGLLRWCEGCLPMFW